MIDSKLKAYLDVCERVQGSDLHFNVGLAPTVRVMGKLKIIGDEIMDEAIIVKFINSILTNHQISVLEEKKDVDCSFSVEDRRYRCNIYHELNGYAISIRSISTNLASFQDLGIPEVIKDIALKKSGLILISGPTGSGKTTTLASIINFLNDTINAHIITIEDPIEYIYNSKNCIITQREIGRDALDFGSALRASLRQDPDVILLGEMRDMESIKTALTAAETGHLVLATIHTTGAENSVDRIIDVFPPEQQAQIRQQLSMVLLCVMSQQLVPGIDGFRYLASEVMIANSAIKHLIRSGKTYQINNILMTNKNSGMQSLEQSLKNLYHRGKISLDICEQYTPQILEDK